MFNKPGEEEVASAAHLAHGITSIRDLGAFRPTEEIRAVQAEFASGERVGPALVFHGAAVSGPPGAWPGMPVAATLEDGRDWARRYAAEGWPVVKAYSLLQPAVLAAIDEEVHAQGLTLFGHRPEDVTRSQALDLGQRGLEHHGEVSRACTMKGDMVRDRSGALRAAATREKALAAIRVGHAGEPSFDEAACRDAAQAMAEAGAWWTPTLTVADVYMGLTPTEASAMATVNPACVFGEEGERGTVEPGQPAELVLLGGDPLADIGATRDIMAVVEDRKLLDRAALDALTEQAMAAGEAMALPAPPQ